MPARRQREACRLCRGTGKTHQFDVGAEALRTVLGPCPKCAGKGYALAPLTDAQRLRALEKDVRHLRQKVRGLEARLDKKVDFFIPGEPLAGTAAFADIEGAYVLPVEPEKPPKLGPQRQLP